MIRRAHGRGPREEEEVYDDRIRKDAVQLLREAYEHQGKEQGMPWMLPQSVSHHIGTEGGSRRHEQLVAYMESEGWIRPLIEEARQKAGAPIYQITPEGFEALREG